jgi:hypothetical protein
MMRGNVPASWGRRGSITEGFMPVPRIIVILLCLLLGLLPAGCAVDSPAPPGPGGMRIIEFTDAVRSRPFESPVVLRSARNQTASFAIHIDGLAASAARKPALRLLPLKWVEGDASMPAEAFEVAEVLSLPVAANGAGFIRHTGLDSSYHDLPRALVPLAGKAGTFPLGVAGGRQAGPMLWIEVHIPHTLPAGRYSSECQLVEGRQVIGSLPIQLEVHDFVIPDQRHLVIAGLAEWSSLRRLYPGIMPDIPPRLLNRDNPEHRAAVGLLDDLVKLAHAHRTTLVVPALQPTVKWPSGRPVQVDWSDYASVVSPWLSGSAFGDLVPAGFWPLPAIDGIERLSVPAQAEYWAEAAAHFDALDWLGRSAMVWPRPSTSPGLAESMQMSEDAARVLAHHPRIRVWMPLAEEQVQLAEPRSPQRITPGSVSRLLYQAPGLVSRPAIQSLPLGGTRYLNGVDPATPYIGAGVDQREARMWAFLAFLRHAELIQWADVLPPQAGPAAPCDPSRLIWFYPGEWFGVDQPVPTLQLKWLRQAQVDHEYLFLARQRGQHARAMLLAQLLTRPVELQTLQDADPVYALLSGTSDQQAWAQGLDLLARTVALAPPGQPVDPEAERQLTYDLTAWLERQRRPLMIARSTDWSMGIIDNQRQSWLNLELGIDIYNPAEQPPDSNVLLWQQAPPAWKVRSEGCLVPKMGTGTINSYQLGAAINGDKLSPASRAPVRIALVEGHSGKAWPLDVVVPVAASEQRLGAPPSLDDGADLRDWSSEDVLHEGPMVRMSSRPMTQRQELEFAPTSSSIYSTWTSTTFYLAFKVDGADLAISNAETSFVSYDGRRAWGEDVCEVLIQPIYSDNTVGPLLHLALKKRGQFAASRRRDPSRHAHPWQGFTSADVRYAANIEGSVWRGELAIPWDAINALELRGRRPAALRFNFSQHFGATGQSASWAGPVDFGRDERFTGLLEIRSPR